LLFSWTARSVGFVDATVDNGCPKLVLLQGDIAVFRAKQMIQDKAQSANNGTVLVKVCNAVLVHLLSSLRASREVLVRGVTPLAKDQPLPARRALRPITSRLAEHGNITLKEY